MIAAPGPGGFPLDLVGPSFYVLVGTLVAFVVMWVALKTWHPRRRRGLEGYREAAGVSLAYLVVSVGLVVALAVDFPSANRTAFALFRTILSGYWLAGALPIVTVGSSVQTRSRRAIPWFLPSIGASLILFLALFSYYYLAPGSG